MTLAHAELTAKIIGAAIDVHRHLGPGFIEGIEVGLHRLDLLVEGTIVVELKAVKNLENVHFAVVKSYLRATGKEHGLLLNFAKATLEVKRVICSPDSSPGFFAS